jgi:hypothetical protein
LEIKSFARLDLDDTGVDPVKAVERNPDYDSDADWSLELEPMEGVDLGDELECVNRSTLFTIKVFEL